MRQQAEVAVLGPAPLRAAVLPLSWAGVRQHLGTSDMMGALLGVVARIRCHLVAGDFTGLEKLDRAELDELDETDGAT